MFETLVCTDLALARHRAGPWAEERDRCLRHCADQGGSRESLRSKARAILRVAERMSPEDFGHVDTSRLHEIACRSTCADTTAATTVATLVNCARPWLKYLDWWHEPVQRIPFASTLDEFGSWMRDERGLTPCTVDQWRRQVASFLRWCGDTDRNLAMLQPMDVDAYFVTDRAQRWSRISAGHIAMMLRVFLRHAASTSACSATLADSIQGRRQYALESLPYALSWDDVRRVIAGADANTEPDIRDRAILLLLSVYGLRRGEVAALRLDQIDRVGGRLHLWRLKRRQPQVYPLVSSVAQALGRYIDDARPAVAHAEVFIRTQAPRLPISGGAIYSMVNRRLCGLGIQAGHGHRPGGPASHRPSAHPDLRSDVLGFELRF